MNQVILTIAVSLSLMLFTNQTPQEMESQIKGLRTTIYKVNDLNAAKEWYSNVFGKRPYFDEPFYVGFEIEGYELGLLPDDSDQQKTANVLSYWGVGNMEAAHEAILKKGATPHEEPTDVGDGILVATVKDPWDNVVGLIYNPHFKLKH